MANKIVGEFVIELAGVKHTLRPSFLCLEAIEQHCGDSIMAMSSRIIDFKMKVRDVVAIIYGGLIGAGDKTYSFEELADLVSSEGYPKFANPAILFFNRAVSGKPAKAEAVSEEKKIPQ